MKKVLLLIIISMSAFMARAQNNTFIKYTTCIDSAVHKGKINHGKCYCTGWATIRKYNDGRKDTVSFWVNAIISEMFLGNEYEQYQKLSDRGRYIVDSLKEDGIQRFQSQQDLLSYDVRDMKDGKKVEQSWNIEGDSVVIYKYSLWKNGQRSGFKFEKKFTVK